MKILITGGAGFIGSHVLQLLAAKNGHEVVVLDNLSSGSRGNVPAGIRLVVDDIRSKNVDALFAREKFDTVVHLAAQTMVPYSVAHPREDCDINLSGMINILECCRRYRVKNVVFSSSAAVYGNNPNIPLKESEIPRPTSFYGISKMAGEHYMRAYHDLCGFNATVLRFANVYGERQGGGGEGGVVSIFCEMLAKGKPVTIFGDGRQTRDFVYAGDVAQAVVAGMALAGHHTINVSTMRETSLQQVLRAFEQVVAGGVHAVYAPPREGDILRSALDNTACKTVLNCLPQMDLAKGIQSTYKYYLNR